jgi:hypothetical protein
MKLLYKPFSILAGIIGARLSRRIFEAIWTRVDPSGERPDPSRPQAPFGKVVGAAALEGATTAATRAAIDRAGAKSFHHLTGVWPEGEAADPAAAAKPAGD